MTKSAIAFVVTSSLALPACFLQADTERLEETDRNKRAARGAKPASESQSDPCLEGAWYGDDECDPFCAEPDPDCDGSTDPCADLGWYDDDICDSYCAEPDPACDTVTACTGGEGCSENQYCALGMGETCGGAGICELRPEACTEDWVPVCGCDGRTHGNPCEAMAAGVAVDHAGECDAGPEPCGGIAGFACADASDVCIFADETCDVVDNMGECTVVPEICTENYTPVCGCDGKTYGNRCEATSAGVSVDHTGDCGVDSTKTCGGIEARVCGNQTDVCIHEDGTCDLADSVGECTPASDFCPDVYSPVCGCDGATYGNRCQATAVGVSVDFIGPCK